MTSVAVGAVLVTLSFSVERSSAAGLTEGDLNPLRFGDVETTETRARRFEVSDALMRRAIVDVRPAHNRPLVAIAISRPAGSGESYVADNRMLDDNAGGRADLLILSTEGGPPVFDSRSISDLRTVYGAAWSPGGDRLAFLGIHHDRQTRLHIWDADTSEHRLVTVQPVRRHVPLRGFDGVATDSGLVWVDDRHLAAVTTAQREDRLAELADAWRRTWEGDASVRVWSTAFPVSCRTEDALVIVSADTGEARTLASGHIKGAAFAPGSDAAIVISAERRRSLAVTDRKAFPPQANRGDYEMRLSWRADVVEVDSGAGNAWLVDAEGPISIDSLPAWSADGSRAYAVTRRDYVVSNGPVELITRDMTFGRDVRYSFASLHSAELAGDIFLAGFPVPEELELSRQPGPNYASEPRTYLEDLSAEQRARLLGSDFSDVAPALPSPPAPVDGARFAGTAGGVQAIFHADTPEGTILWAVAPDAAPRVLLSTNTYFSAIANPTHRPVSYHVGDTQRTGLLYLPTNGSRFETPVPAIVTAYPGWNAPGPNLINPNDASSWALRALLAEGYAAFVVDFRAFPADGAGTLTDRIMREMRPALAAVKALPEIDTNRLGYYGHSYGAVTGLVALSQVPDFSAAVISAPVADFARYGLSARPEVADLACSPSVTLDLQEVQDADGFLSFDGPMTSHLDDYLRESPIRTVGDITTPVLMVRGEFDAFNGADELFAALAEKGVDAELAVYRAEGHNLASPGNVRDAAARIVGWFEGRLARREADKLSVMQP